METADGGTLFLDEVNEMGLGCQAKLLRALERREFRRVGGTRKIAVNIHLLAASNANLEALVESRRFRADLYYRLKVVTLTVPPLRDRKDAIPVLAQRFLEDVARQAGLAPKRLTPDALAQLARYPWPGNIRELRNCMESLTLTSPAAGDRRRRSSRRTCGRSRPRPRSAWRSARAWRTRSGRSSAAPSKPTRP